MTIRLLDPPLHEFLPEGNVEDIVSELASETGAKEEEVLSRVEKLSEVNPMLGFRGCRFDSILVLVSGGIEMLQACDVTLVDFSPPSFHSFSNFISPIEILPHYYSYFS